MPNHIKKFKKVLKKCQDVFCGKNNKSNFHEGQSAYCTDKEVSNDVPRDILETPLPSESLITSPAANRRFDKLMRKYCSRKSKRTNKNRFQLLKEPGARFRFANFFRRKTRKISKHLRHFEDFTINSTCSKRRVVHSYGFPFRRNAVSKGRMNSTSFINSSISDTFILQDRATLDVETISGIRYPKFIPILDPSDQFHPISSGDTQFPCCWIDVQEWYGGWRKLRYQAELQPPEIEDCAGKSEEMLFRDIKQSLSDSMLHDDDVKSGLCMPLFPHKNNKDALFRWKENGINIRKTDFEKCFNYDESDKHSVLVARREMPRAHSSQQEKFEFVYNNHPLAERFCRINLNHFQLVAKLAEDKFCTKRHYFNLNEKPYTELYIEAKGGRYANISLCHLKTEMAHACLKSFFFPCLDVANVMWIKDIGTRILQNIFINEGNVYDVFQRSVKAADITKFQAVIFLSQGAVILLKHRHVCFLDTLSVCLGMEKENVLLIDVGYKPLDII
ncbi:hypothetical protein CHS0354_038926 [Potamilus streckersoni]|uniref:Uncharacterized protein n=1 Tax=Potamilus streckersoni TaxID=2493646 RepID=A0AAE0S118_9BIVA|nr:hypothetical protein CHS0354_038926 [Potamilus streckersoni]